MEFRALGPIELWSAGQRHDLGHARARSILAMLLLTPRAMVPVETLIDRLWDTRPPPKARESLSVYIARLRASLRQAVGDRVQLVGRARGAYLLDVDPEAVDVHQFRRLRRRADTLAASGDHDHAAGLLREADGLWRGQALAGISGDWVARMRDALEEERRAAILERVGCELELGRHADLVGELRHLLAEHPLDETLVAHQMTALYGSGRPADALSLYRETRGRLVEEQGTEPGAMLSELHQRILGRDPRLAVNPSGQRPVLAAPPRALPPETAEFAGRGAELGPLTGENGSIPGIAITEGMPAESLLDGRGAASPEEIAAFDLSYRALEPGHQRFFRRLGVSPCACLSLPAAAALGGCTLAEAGKALDILFDYHLMTGDIDGQFRFHDLIRGYAAARATRDDPEAEQTQAVSRLLDYYLHTADKADRVLHPFRRRPGAGVTRPSAGGPTLDTRENAAGWLESEWRNILRAARYAGRRDWAQKCADLIYLLADFMAIRAYWDEAIAAHTLALQASRDLADPARIAQASLALSAVRQQTGQHETAIFLAEEAAANYRVLADRRGEAESLDQIGLAHQRTARSREALAYFSEARILYCAAADPRGAADTLSHSGIACWHLGRYPEAHAHLRDALSLYRDVGDRRGEAKVLNNLGRVYLCNGHHGDALDAYQKSLQIFREIGGAQNEAILYQNIGSVHRYKGSYEEAIISYRRALAIYRDIGDLPDEADVLNDIGTIYHSAACYDEALIHHQKARLIAEEIGDLSQQLTALRMIAGIHRGSGRYGEALDHYRAALRLAREIGDPYEEGKILEGIAESTLSTQRPHAARIVFRQALDIFERLGVPEAESARIRMETMDPAFAAGIS